jgi:predicted nucleotidyltransferase
MNPTLETHKKQRELLLEKIAESISHDDRFVAAWLTGSLGKNESDSFSDIDISIVVSEQEAEHFCTWFEQVSAQTTPKRLAFFSQFGTPALTYENNNHAPSGGAFTSILYAGSALTVDWILIPQSKATRPLPSQLLFDKTGIPTAPPPEPEELEQSKKQVAEIWAFFWMMIAITIKYIHRNDGVFVTRWIEILFQLKHDIERRLKREPWEYTGSISQLQPTREKQIESIRELYRTMLDLKPAVKYFIGMEPATPLTEIETLLSLGNNSQSKIANPKS